MKDIPGYEGLYAATKQGKIWSYRTNKFLKPSTTSCATKPYLTIDLGDGHGHVKRYTIHRLIALTFIPNPNNYPCVNHIDENQKNNKVSNLEWCSYQYNNSYGTKVERIKRALYKKVRCIETGIIYDSSKAAAKAMGVSNGSLSQHLHGKTKSFAGHTWEFV